MPVCCLNCVRATLISCQVHLSMLTLGLAWIGCGFHLLLLLNTSADVHLCAGLCICGLTVVTGCAPTQQLPSTLPSLTFWPGASWERNLECYCYHLPLLLLRWRLGWKD